MHNTILDQKATPNTEVSQPPVDENGLVRIDGYVRIFDPNTKETLVEIRE